MPDPTSNEGRGFPTARVSGKGDFPEKRNGTAKAHQASIKVKAIKA